MPISLIGNLPPSPLCPICRCEEETTEHLFLLCPWVQSVWFGGNLCYRVDGSVIPSWTSWLQTILSSSTSNFADQGWVHSNVAFTCWFIWKARCQFVFNQVCVNPSNVVFAISNDVGCFFAACSIVSSAAVVRPVSTGSPVPSPRWCPPPPPSVKINVEASWHKDSKSGFVGVVVRDAEATFLAAVRYPLLAPSALATEALALLRGCDLGASMGFSDVILESDSHEAVTCLSNSLENGSWEVFPTLARVKTRGDSFQNCRWS